MFNVMDYGAIGDGIHDDTAAFMAVEAAFRGSIYFPAPPVAYLLSSTVAWAKPGRRFGDGVPSLIRSSVASTDMIQITGQDVEVEEMAFDSAVTRNSGAAYINALSSWSRIAHVRMNGSAVGIRLSEPWIETQDIKFRSTVPTVGVCVLVDGQHAGLKLRGIISEQVGAKHLATVQVNGCQDLLISDSQLMAAQYGLYAVPPNGSQIDSLKCIATYFDGCAKGVYFFSGGGSSINRSRFVMCGASSGTEQGVLFKTSGGSIDGADFIGCEAFLNASNGVELFDGGVQNVRWLGGAIAGNTYTGFAAENSASRFSILGASVGATDGIQGNLMGAAIGAGSSGYNISDNDMRWNTSSNLSDGGTTPKIVMDNFS